MPAPIGPEVVCRPEARAIIENEARKVIQQAGFKQSEFDDISQEITARVLGKVAVFNASRATADAFIRVVAKSAAAMLARERRAEKRGALRGHLSTDVRIGDLGRGTLGTHLMPSDALRRLGLTPGPAVDSESLNAAVESLPDDLARLCVLLKQHSVAEAARMLGIRRQSIYEEHLPAIRRHLADIGFEFAADFFRTPSTRTA